MSVLPKTTNPETAVANIGTHSQNVTAEKDDSRRINFLVTQDLWDKLNDVTSEKGITISRFMRDAIALELWIQEEKAKGNTILVGKDEKYREVLFR